MDAQFAGFGAEEVTAGGDGVAYVPGFEVGVAAFWQFVAAEVKLDARTAAVLDGAEAGFSHDAFAHHASGNHDFARVMQGFGIFDTVIGGVQSGGVVGRAGIVREGDAACADGGEFLPALGDEFVFVGGDCVRGGHASTPCFRLACRNGSRAPSRTAWVLLVSYPVRRSLMRDWSRT